MSGYDQSPDYGGGSPRGLRLFAVLVAVAVVGIAVLPAFAAPVTKPVSKMSVIEVRCTGCGCRGGPGWRSNKTGKCVVEKQLRKQCGSPPSENRCTKEN
jgi:hypothetical protein